MTIETYMAIGLSIYVILVAIGISIYDKYRGEMLEED